MINFVALLVAGIVICNFICFILCGNFIRLWRKLLAVDIRWYLLVVKILVVASIIAIVYTAQMNISTAIFNILLFGGIGILAARYHRSIIGLAVSLMLGPFIVERFTMAYYIYF
jgi:TctA family transporter